MEQIQYDLKQAQDFVKKVTNNEPLVRGWFGESRKERRARERREHKEMRRAKAKASS